MRRPDPPSPLIGLLGRCSRLFGRQPFDLALGALGLAAQLPLGAQRLTNGAGTVGHCGPGIGGVGLGQHLQHGRSRSSPLDLFTERRQFVEGVAGRAQRELVELRQRLGELAGEFGGFDVLADLRLAQPVEQSEHIVVGSRVEANNVRPMCSL